MELTREKRDALREKCKRDLYFLGKTVCKKDFSEQPHREMCAHFVQKDPDIKNYIDLSPIKMRLLMVPRGSFKSSIDALDCVQWIINDPDIRILILTAEKNLAEAFAEEVRSYFTVQDKDDPSDFQLLFPEFCVPSTKREASNVFTTPARKKWRKEPTVWSNSIGSNLPGWHCDILKCDDVVNDVNTREPEQIEKIISSFAFVRKLVDPGGYIDVIGTPYAPNDLYDYIVKHVEPEILRVYAKPAWTLKQESENKPEDALGEADYDLFFPDRLTYDFLVKERKFDPVTFKSQYLIDPRASSRYLFSEKMLENAITRWDTIPKELQYFAVWDLAYGQKMANNFTCGFVVARDRQGRIYLVDFNRGRYGPEELAFRIADFTRRYPIELTGIEDMLGAQWLGPEIDRKALAWGIKPRIFWIPMEKSKDAKINRIARLAPMFSSGQLRISTACPEVDLVVENFLLYTGSKNALDDVPDAVSLLPKFVPMTQALPVEQFNKTWQLLVDKTMDSMMYPKVQEVPTHFEPQPETLDYFGISPYLGL